MNVDAGAVAAEQTVPTQAAAKRTSPPPRLEEEDEQEPATNAAPAAARSAPRTEPPADSQLLRPKPTQKQAGHTPVGGPAAAANGAQVAYAPTGQQRPMPATPMPGVPCLYSGSVSPQAVQAVMPAAAPPQPPATVVQAVAGADNMVQRVDKIRARLKEGCQRQQLGRCRPLREAAR